MVKENDLNLEKKQKEKVGIAALNPDVQPTKEMIEQRWNEIKNGYAYPVIASFPNIMFCQVTRFEKSIADRLYWQKLAELREEDKKLRADGEPGLLDELDVGLMVREWAQERGWNPVSIDEKHRRYSRRIIAEAPFTLTRTSMQMLTPEEIENLSPETRAKYEKEETERLEKYSDWVKEHTTDEERDLREKYYLLQLKNQELERGCIQILARMFASICRMVINVVDTSTIDENNIHGNNYFYPLSLISKKTNTPEYRKKVCEAADAWEEYDAPTRDINLLLEKWRAWEEGRDLDFLSP